MLAVAGRRLACCSCVAPVARGLSSHLARRCFADATPSDDGKSRRLWRWGGTGGGLFSSNEENAETSKVPVMFEDVRGVSMAAVGGAHSAIVIDGQLYTFGDNKYGQLGRDGPESEPGLVSIEGDPAVKQVALGGQHSAIVTESGDLYTWGYGGSFWYGAGALGHSGTVGATRPVLVDKFRTMGEKVKQVACGAQHTLVLTEGHNLYATGKGDFGRLGRGESRDELEFEEIDYWHDARDSILAPGEPTEIVRVGAGHNYNAALSKTGELWVWGRNDYGQLGLGEEAMGDMYSAESFPRLVSSLPSDGHRIVDFCCGEYQLVVLTESGDLYEWGGRTWLEPRRVPVMEEHRDVMTSVVKLAVGDKFALALCCDGTLWSWGSKSSGCLALGDDCPKIVVEPYPIRATSFGHQKVVDVVASQTKVLAITLEDSHISSYVDEFI